ncbi:MAG: hypothetical protein AABX33_06785 [Nanoarchaeota archaeon]
MPLDLIKEVEGVQIVLVILPNETYSNSIMEIAKLLSNKFDSICYVTMNKLYDGLIKNLENNKVNINKFCFIDTITKTADPNFKGAKNCRRISSPSNLTEISLSIGQELKTRKPKCILYDSLSTMLFYKEDQIVTQFVHSLISKLRLTDCITLFTALEGDTEKQMIQNLGMLVDKIIHYK